MLDIDAGHGAGDAAHRDRRVDHRDAGIAVHHHQEIAVEIEQRPCADTRLEEHPDPGLAALFAALGLVGGDGFGVDPGTGGDARQRLAGRLVGDLETHVGKLTLAQHAAFGQRPYFQGHRHAVAFKGLVAPGVG
ncbi:hypothetical protein D3C81_1806660 [compost metagenome]